MPRFPRVAAVPLIAVMDDRVNLRKLAKLRPAFSHTKTAT